MRIPPAPSPDPTPSSSQDSTTSPSHAEIHARILSRRSGTLLSLDHALLHSPSIADGWNSFYGALRTRSSLPGVCRELAICRVAVLNRAWYEWEQHVGVLREEWRRERGEGEEGEVELGSERGVERVKDLAWKGEGLGEREGVVVRVTDEMTVGIIVRDALFAELKRLFSDQEIVELTATIAGYNGVSRFLVALDVGEAAERYGIDMS